VKTDLGQTLVQRYARQDPEMKVGQIIDGFRTKAIRGFQVTGAPEEVADEIEAIVDGSGIDGIMLEPTFGGTAAYTAFIELVLPILVSRGRAEAAPGRTLREHLMGRPRLSPDHRAHRLAARAIDDDIREREVHS
jgi:alkanesulfonate monooxygenase SsuD/methylene tetrahydromethanopterin reductase-like flavin-dependent oxidoreductase (luciferase family)